ncbi:BCL2/adenovirus E1B 19 kDa protein-interacting protein 2-like [Ptychodera flava]|uniref:BCL2/adenovirus E1B 19 kDa protein-interacting protein 2-like n=1 Tax=Ptychodera flava TaxID=63121 RepID=UPI00396A224C
MEKYIDEEEEGDLMSSMRIAENVAKASPRKKSVPQRSIDAEERMAGVNLKEEWQDDDDIMKHHADIGEDWLNDVIEIDITDPVPPRDDALTRPTSLDLGAKPKTRKKVSPPAELKITDNDDDRGSTPSDSFDLSRIDDLQTPDMRTPSLRDDSSILMTSGEMEWEDDTPLSKTTSSEKIPEYTAAEETKDNRHWRVVEIGGKNYNLDMKVIHPYKKVLSHGGYYGDGLNAIIVFAACYLPEKTRKDYNYVMDNLFLYVISTLDLLVAQDYMIIYFHGGCTKHQAPNLGWLKRCYKMIDRRLRKNLKALLLTHPNLWLKTVVRFSKPFISSKFSRKLRFVTSLEDLKQLTPLEYVYIPEQVKLTEKKIMAELQSAKAKARRSSTSSRGRETTGRNEETARPGGTDGAKKDSKKAKDKTKKKKK